MSDPVNLLYFFASPCYYELGNKTKPRLRGISRALRRFVWRGVFVSAPCQEKRIVTAILLMLSATMSFFIGHSEVRMLTWLGYLMMYCCAVSLLGFAVSNRQRKPRWYAVSALPISFSTIALLPLFNLFRVAGALLLWPALLSVLILKVAFEGTAPGPSFVFMWMTLFTITLTYSAESLITQEVPRVPNWVRWSIHPNRVKMAVFSMYFLVMLSYYAFHLGGKNLFSQEGMDVAILQSFAAYVAFDRIVSNLKALKSSTKQ